MKKIERDEYHEVQDAIDRDRWVGSTDTMAIRDGKGKHPPGAICPEPSGYGKKGE